MNILVMYSSFVLMLRQPPRSTHTDTRCPYTTLFRSLEAQAFEALCVARQPKALYCNPTLNNPTTLTWSRQRRATIAAIAQRYGVMIIEDDAYARLPTTPVASLASLAPERTFYLSGLAKCMGAGLRDRKSVA